MAKTITLVDSFTDNTPDTTKWTVYGASPAERIREVNQRVEIRPASNASGSYSGYVSVASYDLTASEVRVEVVLALNANPNAQTTLKAEVDANNSVYLSIQNGEVVAFEVNAGTYTGRATVPYDPARHRWLRLRETNGFTYWETSPEGSVWNVLFSEPTPMNLTAVKINFGAGTSASLAAPGFAVFDNLNFAARSVLRRLEERRLSARDVRVAAAEVDAARSHAPHENNNDEVNYSLGIIGNFSKLLPHDSTYGEPSPAAYASLLRALESRAPDDFDEIVLGTYGGLRLTNPQTGLTFDVEGPDPQTFTLPPAPRFDSVQAAHEAGELYWMAVARDVAFRDYGTDATIAAAVSSLNSEFPQFGGTAPVTAQNVFRGVYPGEQAGPFVSQFLLKGNSDKRKPVGGGQDATDGFISYGAQVIDQRQYTVQQGTGSDYLTTFGDWLAVQNGTDKRGNDVLDTTARRFIRSLRDGTNYVHFDQVLNAYYNAAWILLTEPPGDQLKGANNTGRPLIDPEFLYNTGNPYNPPGTDRDSRTQGGFATFGQPHLLQLLGEVLGRALRAVWWQKWGVHRRLRPEEYGGRVQVKITQGRAYPLDASITGSLSTGGLSAYFGTGKRYGSYLLPQAYPEGAPCHPAYGAGHATGSGAMATILKAFFDETAAIKNPQQANAAGTGLEAYPGILAAPLTVGGELNKLAGNIALFRNAAGVHWRSDYTESLLLGEQIAIGLLQEQSLGFNEDDAFFAFTRFDGTAVRIYDGVVERTY